MAAEGLRPTILWAQRNDTVLLTLSLTDIKNEKFSLDDDAFTFKGYGGSDGNLYSVDLKFYKEVIPQESRHKRTDRGLYFVLKKKETGPYWPRLAIDGKKSFIKTDFNRWKDEDESGSDSENPYNDESLNSLMQQMGGGAMGGGELGGNKPSLDDLDDESEDSDDEPLPDLES